MKILVVGRGGREHSMVMHLAQNEEVEAIYAAPGNAGMSQEARCVDISEVDIEALAQFAKETEIDLTIVGPESSLNEGITNRFREDDLAIFAPTQEAALLEGSKSFAKDFMKKYEIPTADYATFTDVNEAKQYIEEKGAPIVIKADGLAEGKGVIVAETKEVALDAIDQMLVNKAFAEAGSTIVIEECLVGKEFSLMAFVNGDKIYPMMPARDHKRAYDHDEGPNTGGMGAYAPVEDVTEEILAFTNREVLQKAAEGMIKEGRSFTGILYAGLMLTEDGPKVIEFNTRFGDPETQVVLPLMKNDFLQVVQDVLAGQDPKLEWKEEACIGVVLASKGYPGAYDRNVVLPATRSTEEAFVVQAGTKKVNDHFVSNGGRVLLVGAVGKDIAQAREKTYNYLQAYDETDAFFYRKDIGK